MWIASLNADSSTVDRIAWIELYNMIEGSKAVGNGYYVAYLSPFGGVNRLKFGHNEAVAREFAEWLNAA
jgi:hypothetical protein